jgi:hypothetical protein
MCLQRPNKPLSKSWGAVNPPSFLSSLHRSSSSKAIRAKRDRQDVAAIAIQLSLSPSAPPARTTLHIRQCQGPRGAMAQALGNQPPTDERADALPDPVGLMAGVAGGGHLLQRAIDRVLGFLAGRKFGVLCRDDETAGCPVHFRASGRHRVRHEFGDM